MIKNVLKNFFANEKTYIKLDLQNKGKTYFKFDYEFSEDLNDYIHASEHFMKIIKGENYISKCPESILIVPVVANIIPLVWYFDANLIIDEIDLTFFQSLKKIKKAYQKMYPDIDFKGKITYNKLIDNTYDAKDEYICLFSQGVDSLDTVCRNLDKNLHLVTVFGSDIPFKRKDGWEVLSSKIESFSKEINCKNTFVKATLHNFYSGNLNKEIEDKASSNWWHQLQHGISLLAHASVIAYLRKSKGILIASSHSPNEAKYFNKEIIQCASSPSIDNEFKVASCSAYHNGYELDRIDKIKNIINFSKENNIKIPIKVCFATHDGNNCCVCDKCSRTILSIISENENPNDYGFEINDNTFINIKNHINDFENGIYERGWSYSGFKVFDWICIQENFNKNRSHWEDNEKINWILDYDFTKLKK